MEWLGVSYPPLNYAEGPKFAVNGTEEAFKSLQPGKSKYQRHI